MRVPLYLSERVCAFVRACVYVEVHPRECVCVFSLCLPVCVSVRVFDASGGGGSHRAVCEHVVSSCTWLPIRCGSLQSATSNPIRYRTSRVHRSTGPCPHASPLQSDCYSHNSPLNQPSTLLPPPQPIEAPPPPHPPASIHLSSSATPLHNHSHTQLRHQDVNASA